MKIVLTNDDGILSDGLWILARAMREIAPVVIVAPDQEKSAIGTAMTLHQLLRKRPIAHSDTDIEAWAVDGTPGDCTVMALEHLVKDEAALVVSGVNLGLNLGDDVLISGTVSGALQGYLRGLPAMAVSTDAPQPEKIEQVARIAVQAARRVLMDEPPENVFLNINLPVQFIEPIEEIQLTRLAKGTHRDTVLEHSDWKGPFYRLVRQRVSDEQSSPAVGTDVWATAKGYPSITPLHQYLSWQPDTVSVDGWSTNITEELKKSREL